MEEDSFACRDVEDGLKGDGNAVSVFENGLLCFPCEVAFTADARGGLQPVLWQAGNDY
ncbi:MAG: hypothetical protein JXD19_01510 [Deltaproteobacteria bacterium]|nr:hypothetical protein [Deltaproteobacteria bacterium]